MLITLIPLVSLSQQQSIETFNYDDNEREWEKKKEDDFTKKSKRY